jgi:hypothetical protein
VKEDVCPDPERGGGRNRAKREASGKPHPPFRLSRSGSSSARLKEKRGRRSPVSGESLPGCPRRIGA